MLECLELSINICNFALVIQHSRLNMYKEMEENVLTARDTEMMDLETARQLLHQMVKEVYSRP